VKEEKGGRGKKGLRERKEMIRTGKIPRQYKVVNESC